jgi:hypothetical protein
MQCKRPLPIVLHFLDRNETRMVEVALTQRSVKRLEVAEWRSQLGGRERERARENAVQRHVFRARLFHLTTSPAQLTEDLTLMPLVTLHDKIEEKISSLEAEQLRLKRLRNVNDLVPIGRLLSELLVHIHQQVRSSLALWRSGACTSTDRQSARAPDGFLRRRWDRTRDRQQNTKFVTTQPSRLCLCTSCQVYDPFKAAPAPPTCPFARARP